jgi:hypothetical protein
VPTEQADADADRLMLATVPSAQRPARVLALTGQGAGVFARAWSKHKWPQKACARVERHMHMPCEAACVCLMIWQTRLHPVPQEPTYALRVSGFLGFRV